MTLRSDADKTRAWVRRSRDRLLDRNRHGEGFGAKRTPLPMMSKKRRKLAAVDRPLFRSQVLAERPLCEAGVPGLCVGRSAEVNELQRGPMRQACWLDREKVTALCSPCHGFITLHPTWAEHHGHQLSHERKLTSADWARAARLREYFCVYPCVLDCKIDHRLAHG